MSTLGSFIRSLRARGGFSQAALAQLVGLSQEQVAQLEQDPGDWIRPQVLVRLASALGDSPTELPADAEPTGSAPAENGVQTGEFHVGFWESVWTAPAIGLSEAPPQATRLSSRARSGCLFTVDSPKVRRDTQGRPLTPRELVRALGAGHFAAVLVPREMMIEHRDAVKECAQVALAVDGVRVAVCMNRHDACADGFEGDVPMTHAATWSRAVWDRVRGASTASPIPVYFPTDVGAADTVHRLRVVLDGRIEVHAIAPQHWPSLRGRANVDVAPGGRPMIAVAAEPHLDRWRRAVWESNHEVTTVLVNDSAIWQGSPPTMSFLSLLFNRERYAPWLSNPRLYDFLDALEQQGRDIARRSPRVLTAIAERLQLDVATVLGECAKCDFTTRLTPSWVARRCDGLRRSPG